MWTIYTHWKNLQFKNIFVISNFLANYNHLTRDTTIILPTNLSAYLTSSCFVKSGLQMYIINSASSIVSLLKKTNKKNKWNTTHNFNIIKEVNQTTAVKMLPYKFYYNIMTKYCHILFSNYCIYIWYKAKAFLWQIKKSKTVNYTINHDFYSWIAYAMKMVIAITVKSYSLYGFNFNPV